jgi:Asp-tRNA(Asn)/Glu-tRNA(Gln) amidotransferase A subunit family amidase
VRDPAELTAREALRAMRTGALSVERLACACLDRIAAREPAVRAWAFLDPDLVIARARALDAAPDKGPLHGLPIGVKDVIHTRDMPTRHNSPLFADAGFAPDAACVTLLRSAGALIFGKTETVEFAAIGSPAETRNPHDPARTPGGSSSGSAAAVADGHVPIALGTQTGGSIVRPASFCGVWAMKPTWGLVSNEGCKRFAPSLDTVGWFARSRDDLALMLDVLDSARPAPPSLERPLRIGLCRTPMWADADAATHAVFGAAVETLAKAGARVSDIGGDDLLAPLPALQRLIMRAEGRVSFQPERAGLGGAMSAMAEGVGVCSPGDLAEAGDAAAVARGAFDRLAAPFDAILTPSAVGEAPPGLATTGDLLFNGLWTLLHVPCVNVPGWRGPNGMPVGLTLVGARHSDRRVLAAARAFDAV